MKIVEWTTYFKLKNIMCIRWIVIESIQSDLKCYSKNLERFKKGKFTIKVTNNVIKNNVACWNTINNNQVPTYYVWATLN